MAYELFKQYLPPEIVKVQVPWYFFYIKTVYVFILGLTILLWLYPFLPVSLPATAFYDTLHNILGGLVLPHRTACTLSLPGIGIGLFAMRRNVFLKKWHKLTAVVTFFLTALIFVFL